MSLKERGAGATGGKGLGMGAAVLPVSVTGTGTAFPNGSKCPLRGGREGAGTSCCTSVNKHPGSKWPRLEAPLGLVFF